MTNFEKPTLLNDANLRMGFDSINQHLPRWENIPSVFKRDYNPANKIISKWFFSGLDSSVKFYPREGIVKKEALNHIASCLKSFEPKHGHKAPLSDLLFRYVLRTGAYWKGPIGDAKITIKLRNTGFDKITYISPEGYVRDNAEISWHFTDFF